MLVGRRFDSGRWAGILPYKINQPCTGGKEVCTIEKHAKLLVCVTFSLLK